MLSKKRNGWLWVVMLFAVCAVVYGMLSSYPRELAVYSDELRYLDVARSLLQGRGLRVRNMPSDYQKILYLSLIHISLHGKKVQGALRFQLALLRR